MTRRMTAQSPVRLCKLLLLSALLWLLSACGEDPWRYQMQHQSAEQALVQLSQMLPAGTQLSLDQQALLIEADAATLAAADQWLQNYDRPNPQYLISLRRVAHQQQHSLRPEGSVKHYAAGNPSSNKPPWHETNPPLIQLRGQAGTEVHFSLGESQHQDSLLILNQAGLVINDSRQPLQQTYRLTLVPQGDYIQVQLAFDLQMEQTNSRDISTQQLSSQLLVAPGQWQLLANLAPNDRAQTEASGKTKHYSNRVRSTRGKNTERYQRLEIKIDPLELPLGAAN